MTDPHERARHTYERGMAYPLFVVSLMFLVGVIFYLDSQASELYQDVGRVLITISWAVFVVDYVLGYYLSANRRRYFVTHIIQLIGIAFPPARILLFGRVFTVLTTGAKRKLGNRVRIYALYLTTLFLIVASILEYLFERSAAGSNIVTFGDAIWWATETVSTVGYGDFYPVTIGGRIVAVILFINGIALLSAVTATIATKVLEGDSDGQDDEADASLIDLRDRLKTIEEHLATLTVTLGALGALWAPTGDASESPRDGSE